MAKNGSLFSWFKMSHWNWSKESVLHFLGLINVQTVMTNCVFFMTFFYGLTTCCECNLESRVFRGEDKTIRTISGNRFHEIFSENTRRSVYQRFSKHITTSKRSLKSFLTEWIFLESSFDNTLNWIAALTHLENNMVSSK